MHEINGTCYIFIVDTEDYSGNFERELIAYMTGEVGECGVGTEMAELAEKESNAVIDENGDSLYEHCFDLPYVINFSDEHGCLRPATIFATPGWINNGNGSHFKIDSEEALKCVRKYPAYQSVAVAFESELSEENIKLLFERAKYFCENYNKLTGHSWSKNITFTGIRLIHQEVKIEQTLIRLKLNA
jgi:hypothetical protein